MVKSLLIMRHAEREDRAQELIGNDWISTAPRPQDPVLSALGREQAALVGQKLKSVGVSKILCSPMIRTVITADIIANELGLGPNSISVEGGLVEEAKSFRGKTAGEPRPNWSPLVLPVSELKQFSSRIQEDYESLHTVSHEKDDATPNTVREVHPHLVDRDEITKDRCRTVLKKVLDAEHFAEDVVLLVGHGATVLAFTRELEKDLPEEYKITGARNVSCFSEFKPFDATRPDGPWRSVSGFWDSGNPDLNGSDDL